jgi:hypothetical protein
VGAEASGQTAREELHVRTRECCISAPSDAEPFVASLARQRPVAQPEHRHFRESLSHNVGGRTRPARDDDNLKRGRYLLTDGRTDGVGDVPIGALRDDDDRDGHLRGRWERHGVRGVRPHRKRWGPSLPATERSRGLEQVIVRRLVAEFRVSLEVLAKASTAPLLGEAGQMLDAHGRFPPSMTRD